MLDTGSFQSSKIMVGIAKYYNNENDNELLLLYDILVIGNVTFIKN